MNIMLIFYFFSFSISITFYDFSRTIPYSMTFFLNPLDVIEIKVRRGYGTFLSYWKEADDLFLYVDAINVKNNEVSYGPFVGNSGLAGIYFKKNEYIVRLVNDGPSDIEFSMIFSYNYPYAPYKEYPISDVIFPSGQEIGQLSSPFIYYIDHSGSKISLIIMGVIVCILAFVPLFTGCKYENL